MTEMETQMIQAALHGQAQGYRFLMNRYGRQVQLLVAQWVTDMRDVEELTQDVFVRAFEHLSDYNPERASFITWIGCIAQQHCLEPFAQSGLRATSSERGTVLAA